MDDNPYSAPKAGDYRDVVAPAGPGSCPLCGEIKLMKRPKRLYGRDVCARCAHGFANRRQFAYVIDTLLLIAANLAILLPVGAMAVQQNWTEDQFDTFQSVVGWTFLAVFVFKDSFQGYSPGKYLMGVRVIDARSGAPSGLKGSVLRTLPLIIPVVPLIVALTMLKGKRLGDGWARTKVIWNRFADHELFQPESAATAVEAS